MSTTMKAAIHLGENYKDNFVHLQKPQLRGAQDVVRHHAETDLEPEARSGTSPRLNGNLLFG